MRKHGKKKRSGKRKIGSMLMEGNLSLLS